MLSRWNTRSGPVRRLHTRYQTNSSPSYRPSPRCQLDRAASGRHRSATLTPPPRRIRIQRWPYEAASTTSTIRSPSTTTVIVTARLLPVRSGSDRLTGRAELGRGPCPLCFVVGGQCRLRRGDVDLVGKLRALGEDADPAAGHRQEPAVDRGTHGLAVGGDHL